MQQSGQSAELSQPPYGDGPRLIDDVCQTAYYIHTSIVVGAGMNGSVYAATHRSTRAVDPGGSAVVKTSDAANALSLIIEATVLKMLYIRSLQSPKCAEIYSNHIPKLREVYIPRYLRNGPLRSYCDMFNKAREYVELLDLRASANPAQRTPEKDIRTFLQLPNATEKTESGADVQADPSPTSEHIRAVFSEFLSRAYTPETEANVRSDYARLANAAVSEECSARSENNDVDCSELDQRNRASYYSDDSPMFKDSCYIVMDRYSVNAATMLDRYLPGNAEERPIFCEQLLQAGLQALLLLHSLRIVHRDIKAENFFVSPATASSPDSTRYTIVLGDYGFAVSQLYSWSTDEFYYIQNQFPALFDTRPPKRREIFGNQRYASYEAVCGRAPRCIWDIESLVYVVSRAALGELPWSAPTVASNGHAKIPPKKIKVDFENTFSWICKKVQLSPASARMAGLLSLAYGILSQYLFPSYRRLFDLQISSNTRFSPIASAVDSTTSPFVDGVVFPDFACFMQQETARKKYLFSVLRSDRPASLLEVMGICMSTRRDSVADQVPESPDLVARALADERSTPSELATVGVAPASVPVFFGVPQEQTSAGVGTKVKLVAQRRVRKNTQTQPNVFMSTADVRKLSLRKFTGYSKWDPVQRPWHAWLPTSQKRKSRPPSRFNESN